MFHKGKLLANKVGGVLTIGSAKNDEVEQTLRRVQSVLISQQMSVVDNAAVTGRRGGRASPMSGTMYPWSWEAGKPAAGGADARHGV